MNSFSTRQTKWFGLLALVVMWGSAFAVMNIAVREVPPVWMAAGRLWIGAAFVTLMLLIKRDPFPAPGAAPGAWIAYIIVGIFGTALPFLLFAWGAAHTQSALLGISNGASPIFTALLTAFFIPAEKLGHRAWLGVLLGFLGLVVLVGPQAWTALQGVSGQMMMFLGIMAGIAGAFCYSVANIITRRAPEMNASAAAVIFCITGALVCTGLGFATAAVPAALSPVAWACLVALGIFPTGFASIMYVWIIRTHGPVFASLATYLTPLWATAVGILFLGEKIGVNAFVALLLIIAGVAVASRKTAG
jgi:drug/metabolite transporter (DMT)-like permease